MPRWDESVQCLTHEQAHFWPHWAFLLECGFLRRPHVFTIYSIFLFSFSFLFCLHEDGTSNSSGGCNDRSKSGVSDRFRRCLSSAWWSKGKKKKSGAGHRLEFRSCQPELKVADDEVIRGGLQAITSSEREWGYRCDLTDDLFSPFYPTVWHYHSHVKVLCKFQGSRRPSLIARPDRNAISWASAGVGKKLAHQQ